MRKNKLELFIHCVWATWDWQPLITGGIERRLHRAVAHELELLHCKVVAIGGMMDHIHLLIAIPTTITVADMVKRAKGVSSHFVNDVLLPTTPFKWQGSYGAFSVSYWDVDTIVGYIRNQPRHHGEHQLLPGMEETGMYGDLM